MLYSTITYCILFKCLECPIEKLQVENKNSVRPMQPTFNSSFSSPTDTSQLSGVTLTSATLIESYYYIPSAPPAPWVEVCTCPPGFVGQFCEQCAPGFTRDNPNGGPYSPCVPCNCNHHGTCHPETGL